MSAGRGGAAAGRDGEPAPEVTAVAEREEPIRILITDDHPVVRDGLRAILAGTGFVVVGEAESGPQAAARAAELGPDVVLMDVRMPGGDGLSATRRVREAAPGAAVVILTSFEDETYLREAIAAGAAGFVLKGSPRELLVDSIRIAHAGGSSFPPAMLSDLVDPAPGARGGHGGAAATGGSPAAAAPIGGAPGRDPAGTAGTADTAGTAGSGGPTDGPSGGATPRVIRAGALTIDAARHDVRVGERRVDLSYMEFRALWRIALGHGEVVSTAELHDALWPGEAEEARGAHRLVSLVARIRSRLGPQGREILQTVRRVGYRLAEPGGD